MNATWRVIPGRATSDGAGVKIHRSIGAVPGNRLDPFLMLDEFFSDQPEDYLGGFPAHPHRGFETITYMIDGRMRHEDHLGNQGDLGPGDVQWMTAGKGIIHSEMPQQTQGRMRGFQLWLNLPAAEKMKPATYRDIPAADIPIVHGVKVIAGQWQGISGPVSGQSTDPLFLDVHLSVGEPVRIQVKPGHAGFLYAYQGNVHLDGEALPKRAAVTFDGTVELELNASEADARVLVLAARPIGEPVVQHGPFVMNSREEIEQAMRDYAAGELAT